MGQKNKNKRRKHGMEKLLYFTFFILEVYCFIYHDMIEKIFI